MLNFVKLMEKGLKGDKPVWTFLRRWLFGWGVCAHIVAAFLFAHAVL